jgi:hypothetical protein
MTLKLQFSLRLGLYFYLYQKALHFLGNDFLKQLISLDIVSYMNSLLSVQFHHEYCVCRISTSVEARFGSACTRSSHLAYQVEEFLAAHPAPTTYSCLIPVLDACLVLIKIHINCCPGFTSEKNPQCCIDIKRCMKGSREPGLLCFCTSYSMLMRISRAG